MRSRAPSCQELLVARVKIHACHTMLPTSLMDIHVGLAALHPETVQAKVTLKATWLSWEQACDLGRRACCVRWM